MAYSKTIGLIGYGHLGHALADEIQKKSGAHLVIAENRTKNIEVSSASDILILTVRPTQVAEVMREVREWIRGDAVVLSFAAAVPSEFIAKMADDERGVTVIRAMADIHFRQIIAQDHDSTNGLLEALSQHPLLKTDSEKDIDAFTVLVGCLPGVCAWQFTHNPQANAWLSQYADFIHQQVRVDREVSLEIIQEVRDAGHFEEKMQTVATKGGVTERLLQAFSANPTIRVEQLFEAGMLRIQDVKNAVTHPAQAQGS